MNEEIANELIEVAETLLQLEIGLEKIICETADFRQFVTPAITALNLAAREVNKAAIAQAEADGYIVV